jgi:ribosome biogenesis GTPase
MSNPPVEGTVIENRGAVFDVLIGERVVRCFLRGKLKKGKQRQVSLIAAGDRVVVTLLEPGKGVVEQVLPRGSEISRRATGGEPLQQVLAANVEQAVIVFAAAEPRPDFYMLDRFLVVATAAGLDQVVCVNKCDLVEPGQVRAHFALDGRIGYRVLYTSARRGEGLEGLRAALKDHRSIICGPSGVGKSSLLNAVAPGLSLRTRDVGTVTHKGRHGTSSVTMLPLTFGGWIADTPGLRQLAFWHVSRDQVAQAFPDLGPYLGRCRFSNCSHGKEEGCALRDALASGKVNSRRLKSYLQLAGERT